MLCEELKNMCISSSGSPNQPSCILWRWCGSVKRNTGKITPYHDNPGSS